MPVRETKQSEAQGKRVVKKLPLSERVTKLLDKAGVVDKVFEMQESVVTGEENNKNNVVFVIFTDKKKQDIDHEENVSVIKDFLFYLSTNDEELDKGKKSLVAEVVRPENEDEPFMMSFQEYAE